VPIPEVRQSPGLHRFETGKPGIAFTSPLRFSWFEAGHLVSFGEAQ
jgi:hypothetical protein